MLRKLFLLPCLLLLPLLAFPGTADTSKADLFRVFVQKNGKTSVNVLRLRTDNTYEYVRYTKKKSTRDYGRYVLARKMLRLESQVKRGAPNPLLHKVLYVSDEGLHRTRFDAWRKRKPLITANDDEEYRKKWEYNPLTQNIVTATEEPKPELPKMKPGEYAKQFYMNLAYAYSPGYDSLLAHNYCGPDCYKSVVNGQAVEWAGDTTAAVLFNDYETMIHESTHNFNNNNYMVFPGLSINVVRDKTYNSAEFAAIVPKDASANIFRYETYVGKNSVVSSNLNGIFGLLDEYSAYLNGVRACLLAARTAAAQGDTVKAQRFISMTTSTSQANYEFRLFTAWYLHYAKQKYPAYYNAYMNNQNLRVAFTLIDSEFKKTNLAIAEESKKMFGYNKIGVDYHNGIYNSYIEKQLKKEDPYLVPFLVKGVTTANYKSYIK